MKRFFLFIVVFLMVFLFSIPAFAIDSQWDGDASGFWNTGANWVSNTAAGAVGAPYVANTDTATFNNNINTAVIVDDTRTVQNITFDALAGAFTLSSGGTLRLSANGVIQNAAGVVGDLKTDQNLNSTTQLYGAYTFKSNALNNISLMKFGGVGITQEVTGILTLGGANTGDNTISTALADGAGILSLDKIDAGTWVLSGANTYTGVTTISAGKLSVTTGSGLGSTAAGTSVANTATLDLAGTFAVGIEAITLAAGSTLSSSSGINSISGSVNVTGTSTVDVVTSLTLSGDITGSAYPTTILAKTGAGILILSGNVDNYNLSATVNGGTLSLEKTVSNAVADLTLTSGTVRFNGTNDCQIWDSGKVTLNGGTFDQNGKDESIGTLVLNGATISGLGTLTINDAAIDARSGSSSAILAGSQGLTKTTAGIVTLSGANTYTGLTDVQAGELDLNTAGGANAIAGNLEISGGMVKLLQADQIADNKAVTVNGILDLNGNSEIIGSLAGSGTVTSGAVGSKILTAGGDNSSTTFSGVIQNGSGTVGFTKAGSGTFTLSGPNTYTGDTAITGGTLILNNGLSNNVKFNGAGTMVKVASDKSIAGTITTQTDTQGTLSFLGATTISHDIGASGKTLSAVNFGDGAISGGAVTLDYDVYASTTTINKGSSLTTRGTRTITGALTLSNSATTATLDIGANILNVAGIYTQDDNSMLKVTIDSPTTSGKISSSFGAVVSATSKVDVRINSNFYIPQNTTFTIIDGFSGTGVNVPGTINTLGDSRVSFFGSSLNGDLILTADRTTSGFASLTNNSNAQAVGLALDNITNPTADMTTILNTLEGLSDAQTGTALDTMVPTVDAGVLNNSNAALNNFIGVSLGRTQSVLTLAAAGNSPNNCVLSSDEKKLSSIWAKEYGSYLDQGTRKGIQGYSAWNAGTAIGADRLFSDVFTFGLSGGYTYGHVNSIANNGKTNINSGQGTIYAGYQDANIPYFIDVAGSFAWNWYKGKRDINVGAINRIAYADYEGQQYGVYLGGGYKFKLGKHIELAPLASLQWNRLCLGGYTETNADSLNLTVNRQSYDILQSGLGIRIVSPIRYKCGNITPELHVKWLYDFIGDDITVTSTFTGGGGSFTSNGAKPSKSRVNLGGKLSFDLSNNISLIAECDTNMASDFFGVYASTTLRYKF